MCLGFPAWEGDYQKSTVQLMQALARQQRVLYVEYPFTWKDAWRGLRGGNPPWRRMLGLEPRLRSFPSHGPGHLHVLTLPPLLPVNGLDPGAPYERLAEANAEVARRSIRRALQQLGYHAPLLLNAFNPFLGAYLHDRLDACASYYYCYDEIGAARWTHRHGPRLEARLLPQVDGLIASSQPLLTEKGQGSGPEAQLLLKNGVNVSLFERAFAPHAPKLGPLTLGYLGSVDDRLDVDLLLYLLDQWPQARLLLVGRISHAAVGARLGQHPRVELAGPQPLEELPLWLRRMHVGLIPFVRNAFTRYIYPLKINEYLAAGLPVVSTAFGELQDFYEVAQVVDGPDQFLAACQQAVAYDQPAQRKMRRAFARQQSWQGRAHELTAWLSARHQLTASPADGAPDRLPMAAARVRA